jgi:hypothetical protein
MVWVGICALDEQESIALGVGLEVVQGKCEILYELP